MYVQEIIKKRKGKTYRSVLIRESYRKGKNVYNRTVANISKLPDACIKQIQDFFRGSPNQDLNQFQIIESKEYGASKVVLSIMRELGLDKLIYSKKIQWREDVLAMIAGRLTYPGSKLSLTNMFADTTLWELCGHSKNIKPDVNEHCYQPLDRLLECQKMIQIKLAKKHLKTGCVVLYDMTSSYFEGEYEDSDLVTYGYNRDRKQGHEQVNIGLLTNTDGCPIAIEVFPGNTPDQVTVKGHVKNITDRFKVKDVIFVGDRGMLTPKRIVEVNAQGFKTVTALTHAQMHILLDNKIVKPSMFSRSHFPEVIDPSVPHIRYMLCFNPKRQQQDRATRLALIKKSKLKLDKICQSKRKKQEKDIGISIGRIWEKYKTKKYFSISIENERLTYSTNQSVIDREALLDGCYIMRTEVPQEELSAYEVVQTYRKLAQVEQAFRVIKTTLEIRPVDHHLDERICAHIFLCMLAYYVQWHMNEKLADLFAQDGEGQNRRWTFLQVIERLKSIRSQTVRIADSEIEQVVSKPDAEQQLLIDLLDTKV